MRGRYYDENWEPLSWNDYTEGNWENDSADESFEENWELAVWDNYIENEFPEEDEYNDDWAEEEEPEPDDLVPEDPEYRFLPDIKLDGDIDLQLQFENIPPADALEPPPVDQDEAMPGMNIAGYACDVNSPEECMDSFFSGCCDGDCKHCAWWMDWIIRQRARFDPQFTSRVVEECYNWFQARNT